MLVTAEMVDNSLAFVGQRLKCSPIDDAAIIYDGRSLEEILDELIINWKKMMRNSYLLGHAKISPTE